MRSYLMSLDWLDLHYDKVMYNIISNSHPKPLFQLFKRWLIYVIFKSCEFELRSINTKLFKEIREGPIDF